MSRIAKFKAWDKKNKQWSLEDLYIDENGRLFEIWEASKSYQTYMEKRDVTDDHEIVWFTGLKDMNGKEIYEGDLFKIENHWPVYVVVYAEEAATFGLKSRGGPFKPFTTVLRDMEDYPLSEVLGNIYENPELLKEAAADA